MSSDAEILAPRSHLGGASRDAVGVLRLSGALLMLTLPARAVTASARPPSR